MPTRARERRRSLGEPSLARVIVLASKWQVADKDASYEKRSDIRHFPLRMRLLPSGGCANPGWRTQKTGCRRRTRANPAESDRPPGAHKNHPCCETRSAGAENPQHLLAPTHPGRSTATRKSTADRGTDPPLSKPGGT